MIQPAFHLAVSTALVPQGKEIHDTLETTELITVERPGIREDYATSHGYKLHATADEGGTPRGWPGEPEHHSVRRSGADVP
jgi:hypothetical protein